MSFTPENQEYKFLFDLRQRRAKVIADQIDLTVLIMRGQDYYSVYRNIDILFTVSKHAFKEKKKDKKDKNIEEEYTELKNKLFEVTKKHNSVWTGINLTAQGCEEIETKLKDLLAFVLLKIEESELFGTATRSEYEGI